MRRLRQTYKQPKNKFDFWLILILAILLAIPLYVFKFNKINSLPLPSVLGLDENKSKKHIYVDLEKQTLLAYEDKQLFMKTLISSGLWGRTPTGNFNIWSKFKSARMAGGSGNDAYDLPNVPYTMYFYGDFGLHGAYWHNNFGHPMSHGCVNMRIADAKDLFAWADGPQGKNLGTPVSVCDQFLEESLTCIQNHPVK